MKELKKNLFNIPTENICACNLLLSQCNENEKIDFSIDFLKKKFPLLKFEKKKKRMKIKERK